MFVHSEGCTWNLSQQQQLLLLQRRICFDVIDPWQPDIGPFAGHAALGKQLPPRRLAKERQGRSQGPAPTDWVAHYWHNFDEDNVTQPPLQLRAEKIVASTFEHTSPQHNARVITRQPAVPWRSKGVMHSGSSRIKQVRRPATARETPAETTCFASLMAWLRPLSACFRPACGPKATIRIPPLVQLKKAPSSGGEADNRPLRIDALQIILCVYFPIGQSIYTIACLIAEIHGESQATEP